MSIDITGLPQPRAEEPRTKIKRLRLSDAEVEASEASALESGMTWSQWIRRLMAKELHNIPSGTLTSSEASAARFLALRERPDSPTDPRTPDSRKRASRRRSTAKR